MLCKSKPHLGQKESLPINMSSEPSSQGCTDIVRSVTLMVDLWPSETLENPVSHKPNLNPSAPPTVFSFLNKGNSFALT